jgi:hypothetical protein
MFPQQNQALGILIRKTTTFAELFCFGIPIYTFTNSFMFNESYHLVLILLLAFFIGFVIAWQYFGQETKKTKEQVEGESEKLLTRQRKKIEDLRAEKLAFEAEFNKILNQNAKEEKDFEGLRKTVKKQQFRIDELKVQEGTMHNQLMEAERFLEFNIGLDEHNAIKEELERQIEEQEVELTELKEQLESMVFKLTIAQNKSE